MLLDQEGSFHFYWQLFYRVTASQLHDLLTEYDGDGLRGGALIEEDPYFGHIPPFCLLFSPTFVYRIVFGFSSFHSFIRFDLSK